MQALSRKASSTGTAPQLRRAMPPMENAAMAGSAWVGRLLLWVCGGWFLLTVAVGYVATANFSQLTPERLREAQTVLKDIGDVDAKARTLRYIASELNRHVFSVYGWANLTLAALALVLFGASGRRTRWGAVALVSCLGIAAIGVFYLTPTLVEIGRQIDFVPRQPPSAAVRQFYWLHGVNEGIELLKLVLLTGVTVSLLRAR